MNTVYEMQYIVGAHSCFSKKLHKTLWKSVNYGMLATQFFLGSPRSLKRTKLSQEDIEECEKILKKWPMHIFSHFPYMANLAKTEVSQELSALEYEIHVLSRFFGGVVLHPGINANSLEGLSNISKNINKINFQKNCRLLLENCAGQKNNLGATIQELSEMLRMIDSKKKKYIGICIDTCHLFAMGEYDIRKTAEIDRFFTEFDEQIGIEKLWLIHLNDSMKDFGSKMDRHACLGTGKIWGKSFESLIYLLEKCKNIPIVLETHGVDMITLACLHKRE